MYRNGIIAHLSFNKISFTGKEEDIWKFLDFLFQQLSVW